MPETRQARLVNFMYSLSSCFELLDDINDIHHLLSPYGPLMYSIVVCPGGGTGVLYSAVHAGDVRAELVEAGQIITVLPAEWARIGSTRELAQTIQLVQLGKGRAQSERKQLVLPYWTTGEAVFLGQYGTHLTSHTARCCTQYSTMPHRKVQKVTPNAPDTAWCTMHRTLQRMQCAAGQYSTIHTHTLHACRALGASRVSWRSSAARIFRMYSTELPSTYLQHGKV